MPSFKSLVFLAAAAAAEVFTVEVGESGLKFEPQTVTAKQGDTVIFHLYPKHDVAQGAFDKPCHPSSQGLYSGPFADTDNGAKKFVVNVTSTDPIYYYCTVPNHCQGGMVGGINIPTGDKDITAFAAAAAKADGSTRPASLSGGQLLDDAAIASLTASASPSATPAPTSSGSPSASGSSAPPASGTSAPPASSASGKATGASTTPSPTNAAGKMGAGFGLAAVVGVAAWAL